VIMLLEISNFFILPILYTEAALNNLSIPLLPSEFLGSFRYYIFCNILDLKRDSIFRSEIAASSILNPFIDSFNGSF
jgi:hypothetical protein